MVDFQMQTDEDASTQTNDAASSKPPPRVSEPSVPQAEASDPEETFRNMLGSEEFAMYIAKIVTITQCKNTRVLEQKIKEVAQEYREARKVKAKPVQGNTEKRKLPDDINESSVPGRTPPVAKSPENANPRKKKNYSKWLPRKLR